MIDFLPWMILSTVVILAVAGWGAVRGGVLQPGFRTGMERVPEAERAFADCFAEHGLAPPRLEIYREPGGEGLVIVGPDDLDERSQAVLADCDRRLASGFASGD